MERKGNRLPIFTQRFRELQGERSNTDFADFLGLSRQTVGFYCNGDRLPDVITLIQIAEKCNVSTDYLLGLTNVQTPNTNVKTICEYTGLNESTIYKLNDMGKNAFGFSSVKFFIDTLIGVRSVSVLENSIKEAVTSRWACEDTPAENGGPMNLDELKELSLDEYEKRMKQIKLGCQYMKDRRRAIAQEGLGVVLSFDDAEAFFIERATAFLHSVICSCTDAIVHKYRPESK